MFRKTLTILSLLGLLLSVGLWVRSHYWIDSLVFPATGKDNFEASSMLGVIQVGLSHDSRRAPVGELLYYVSDAQEYSRNMRDMRNFFRDVAERAGRKPPNFDSSKSFRWDNSTITSRGITFRTKAVTFPHWLLALLFSIPLFVRAKRVHRRRKRKMLGLCVECGYDLRGSKERCPECGKGFAPGVARPHRVSGITSSISIVVAWHLIFFPATLVFADWLLGYGATVNGVTVLPTTFHISPVVSRALIEFLHPILMCVYAAILFIEGGLAWIVFRERRGSNFRLFLSSWRRICLWGVLGLPVLSAVVALFSRSYGVGMNFPLLWVPVAVVLVTLTTRMNCVQGHCQKCGYDLRGSKERCPECGKEFESSGV